jgi:hypothetical protein
VAKIIIVNNFNYLRIKKEYLEMVNYKNGKIYKLINDELGLTYIGSTSNTLSRRFFQHKSSKNNCKSKILFTTETLPKIFLIESFPCDSKIELLKRERHFIENLDCVNKQIPTRTGKEWRNDFKEKIKEERKQYYIDNREHLIIKQKIYTENRKEEYLKFQKEYHLDPMNKARKKELYQLNKDELNRKRRLKYLESKNA